MKNRSAESFLKSKKNLWVKNCIETLFNLLEKLSMQHQNDRSFDLFILEVKQAYKIFLAEIKSIKLIINTRAKCNNESNFGGMQCAQFMHSIRNACEKYLKVIGVDNVFINQIREKAQISEKRAWEIEYKNKEDYNNFNKDNTLKLIIDSGYEI